MINSMVLVLNFTTFFVSSEMAEKVGGELKKIGIRGESEKYKFKNSSAVRIKL